MTGPTARRADIITVRRQSNREAGKRKGLPQARIDTALPTADHRLLPHWLALLGHVSAEMSLRYGRLFDATVRDEYQRALTQAKAQLGPVLPADRTQLPLADITGGNWRDTPLIKARLAGGYCLRAAAQGPCAYANICEHCPNFRTEANFLPILQLQRADAGNGQDRRAISVGAINHGQGRRRAATTGSAGREGHSFTHLHGWFLPVLVGSCAAAGEVAAGGVRSAGDQLPRLFSRLPEGGPEVRGAAPPK